MRAVRKFAYGEWVGATVEGVRRYRRMVTGGRERVRQWLVEVWPCLPFIALCLVGAEAAASFQLSTLRRTDVLAYVLMLAAALALAARRFPALCLTVNGVVVTAYLALGYPYGPVLLTVPAAAFLLAARWPLLRSVLVVAADLGVLVVASGVKRIREPGGVDAVGMWWQTLAWGWLGAAAVAVGAAVRAHRETKAALRTEQVRRVASDERLRMAQDLHDTIGHGLAVIAMQSGVALHLFDRNPKDARAAVEAARATSRESLENLRGALENLRTAGAAERHPAPGLGDLDRLIDRVRSGGVAVSVDLASDLPVLPPAVDAAAYRILQESLTNVLRHAGTGTARVRLACADGTLQLEVTDTGQARAGGSAATRSTGSGIRGMCALAESLGGTLQAGPLSGGGFTVAARLPLRGGSK